MSLVPSTPIPRSSAGPSRHHNLLYSVALFERARDDLEFDIWGKLADRSVRDLWTEMGRILDRFDIGLG